LASDKVNYPDAAGIAQAMKHQVRSGAFWDDLTAAAKESLDQIVTLIGRTVAGDGAHWDSIVGYAQAAKPADEPPTIDIERGVRQLIDKVARTGNA